MMRPSTKMSARAVALMLPALLLCGSVFYSLAELSSAPTVRIPIVGYDPVDVLHGHYIQLRFDDRAITQKPTYYVLNKESYCVCLHGAQAKTNAVGEYVSCEKRPSLQCDMWTSNTKFFSQPHKYFVDERYAAQLDKLVRDATPRRLTSPLRPVVSGFVDSKTTAQSEPEQTSRVTVDVAISPHGAMKLKMLNIDDKPWRESLGPRE